MNRIEPEGASLSGDLGIKDKSFSKRFWAYASSLLCVWFFLCGGVFYEMSGFRSTWRYHWDYALRVRMGQTALSSSDFVFGAAIFCGICAVAYFVFGILVRKPFAVACGYVHLFWSIAVLYSAVSYIDGVTPADPLEQLPNHFVTGFAVAQIFFLVYCVAGIFSPPPNSEYVPLTGENS